MVQIILKMQKKTLEAVGREVEWHETEMFLEPSRRTPGRRAELRAWKSIQHILEKCQVENSSNKEKR